MAPNSVHVFLKSWSTYQEIIRHNYMFHQEISSAVKTALTHFKPNERLRVLDLGCGDASMTLPLLSSERIQNYVGCDLSKPALDIANDQVSKLNIPAKLLCEDMVSVIAEQPPASADLIISSYALHHLTTSQKCQVVQAIAQTLSPNGCFVLIDIFREPDEDRPSYMRHYIDQLKTKWIKLSPDAQDMVIDHATEHDLPEHSLFYRSLCKIQGLGSSKLLAKHTWHEAWVFSRAELTSS